MKQTTSAVNGSTASASAQHQSFQRHDWWVNMRRPMRNKRAVRSGRRSGGCSLVASTPQQRFDALDAVGTEVSRARTSWATCWRAKKARRCPRRSVRSVGGPDLQVLAGEALRIPGEKLASVRPGLDIEVTREPIGWWESSRPGIFRSPFRRGRFAPALAYGNCVVFKPAIWCRVARGRSPTSSRAAGCPQEFFNLVMGRAAKSGRHCWTTRASQRFRSRAPSPPAAGSRRRAVARMAKFQLEMGRQRIRLSSSMMRTLRSR